MSDFKPAFGFCAKLYGGLTVGGELQLRQLDAAVLCATIGVGGETNLIVASSGQTEIIRVGCSDSGPFIVGRAQEDTASVSFPAGADIYFDWTTQNMLDLIDCREEEESEAGAPIKIPGFTAEFDSDLDQWCYEPDPEDSTSGGPIEWFDCGRRFFLEDGVVKAEPAHTSTFPNDGVFTNATVTVRDGKIVDVQKGCPVVYESKCADCGCDTDP